MSELNRERLSKLLGMLGSAHDGGIARIISAAEPYQEARGLMRDWRDLDVASGSATAVSDHRAIRRCERQMTRWM
jgi:hypothetical protein